MNALRFLIGCLLISFGASPVLSAPPDDWLPGFPAQAYPFELSPSLTRSNVFDGLRAEALAGRLKIFCPAESLPTNAWVAAFVSADAPGHWPARDWQALPMTRRGQTWETPVPVDDLETPLVYFIAVRAHGNPPDLAQKVPLQLAADLLSPLRVVYPGKAGLSEPTRLFWSFLDGFEENLASWRMISPEIGYNVPEKSSQAHTGDSALAATIPAGKRSITIATTSIRGRHLSAQRAKGFSLWLKTRSGEARARFTLVAHAGTDQQVTASWPTDASINSEWQQVTLLFSALPPAFPLAQVDLVSLEFIGQGPLEFFIDDLELLGNWSTKGE